MTADQITLTIALTLLAALAAAVQHAACRRTHQPRTERHRAVLRHLARVRHKPGRGPQ